MKKCVECNAEVDDRAYVCPKCGSGTLIGSYSAEDALSMLDSMQDQYKAKEHVDNSMPLYLAGQYNEAIAELQIALKLAPLNPTAHGNMGAILLKQGKPEQAIPWLEKALELNPNLEGIPQALATAKASMKEKSDKSGCFIATACYKNADCEEVRILRTYRDERLSNSRWGNFLINIYYTFSPPIAKWLEKRQRLCSFSRKWILDPIVNWLKKIINYKNELFPKIIQ